MALFRTDYSGRGELSERQQKLAQVGFLHLFRAGSLSTPKDAIKTEQSRRRIQRMPFLSPQNLLLTCLQIAILLTNQVQCSP